MKGKLRFSHVFFGASVLLLLACTGGNSVLSTGDRLLGFRGFYGFANGDDIGGLARLVSGNTTYEGYLPPTFSVQNGQPLFIVPKDTVIMERTSLIGSGHTLSLTNVFSGDGGVLANVTPVQSGSNIRLSEGFALTPGRWRLNLEGEYQHYNNTPSTALNVKGYDVEFDVFGNGFSNLITSLRGPFPRNGQTASGFSVMGQILPNQGSGPADLELDAGATSFTSTGNKSFGAETWDWDFPGQVTVPQTGLDRIRLNLRF